MCPTMSPSLGTPTPAIIPAITSCSPCIKTASNIISTTTETHVERVHITITLLVQAPCTPTPPLFNTKHSGMPSNPKSCNNSNFTTTVVPTACNNSNFTTTVMPTAATHPAATSTYDSTTPLALGALIGLLTVLLLTLTTGWVCTCWIINRKKQAEIRTQNTRYSFKLYALYYYTENHFQYCPQLCKHQCNYHIESQQQPSI